jgi:predicted TIM-barrel fold metal-dependent hydrolase
MASRDFDPERMLSVLAEEGVKLVLIGGMAAILHGDVGVTVDLDVVPDREAANLERLARALQTLGARIRTAGQEKDRLALPRLRRLLDRLREHE